jgi:hypothetical protein
MTVLDGKESRPYADIGAHDLVFSPDSRHFAYVARQGTGWQVVEDEKPGKEFESIAIRPFSFSPDGKRVAFVASATNKFFLVVGGRESSRYDQFLFSPHAGNTFKSLQIIGTTPDPVFGRRFVRVEAAP